MPIYFENDKQILWQKGKLKIISRWTVISTHMYKSCFFMFTNGFQLFTVHFHCQIWDLDEKIGNRNFYTIQFLHFQKHLVAILGCFPRPAKPLLPKYLIQFLVVTAPQCHAKKAKKNYKSTEGRSLDRLTGKYFFQVTLLFKIQLQRTRC